MKYQPPFDPGLLDPVNGIHNADADAPFVNGDPRTGQQGSIPPAAAIEHPQREIVAVIEHAGIVPSHAATDQLRQAISHMIDTEVEIGGLGGGVSLYAGQDEAHEHQLRTLKPGTNVTLLVEPDGAVKIDVAAVGGGGGGTVATVTSGEGVEIDAEAQANLQFEGLAQDNTPVATDLFARFMQTPGEHKSLTWAAMLAAVSGRLVGVQRISATGTYTKTAGTKKVLAFVTGGGGGGGGNPGSNTAAGGGAAETVLVFADISAVNTVACTIGAAGFRGATGGSVGGDGGDTSFGAYGTAKGGKGGSGINGWHSRAGLGGAGGTGTAIVMNMPGAAGGAPSQVNGGSGGNSFWGGGGIHGCETGSNPTYATGGDATGYGSGGGGGDGHLVTGGLGGAGVILVLEFS